MGPSVQPLEGGHMLLGEEDALACFHIIRWERRGEMQDQEGAVGVDVILIRIVSESTRAYHFGRGKLQFPRKLSTMSKTSRATLH